MRLQRLPGIVGTERRVSEVVRQRIPGHRTGDGERPTAERAATVVTMICKPEELININTRSFLVRIL